MRTLFVFLVSTFFIVMAQPAFSAGFALKEQSASALGNAFAGATAAAEDVSYMFFNPAALGQLEGNQLSVVGSYIAPSSEMKDGTATTILGTPIGGNSSEGDAAKNVVLPAGYVSWALTDEWRFGLAVTVPYGLETNYDRDWIGRYHAVNSRLQTMNINPVLAWKANEKVTLAFGFQAQYAEAELTNAIDFGTIAMAAKAKAQADGKDIELPDATPAGHDGYAKMEGDDWGFGYNLGLMIEPREGTRIGLAYRSKVHHNLRGDIDFRLDNDGVGAALSQATGRFVDSRITADLTTPETVSIGLYHEITPRWAVMADATLTRWSRFDELRVQFDNPAEEDNVTIEDWNDSWFYALGLTWKPSEKYALRIGVAHDETPIPDRTRTPRIPATDRTWLALGGHYKLNDSWGFDAGYTHIWVEDSSIELEATPTNDTFRGNLDADYENDIDIVTLSATYTF
ncbi:OmpP1/FadL family transporter [Geoalkalibacter subterraneus]|nr:OmpP1/FadL family transporter [Geoalkalibacter subterraneus]